MRNPAIKILLCFGMLGASAAAFAQDAGGDASRQLQNLVYYPHAGHLRAMGSFVGSLDDSGSTTNGAGAQTVSRSSSYQKASLALNYGLIDGLRLGISETELFNQQALSTNLRSNVVTTNDSNGPSDPVISLAQRLHDSSDDGLYADAVVSATPRLGRALAAGGGQTGNDLASAWNATASIPVYYRHHLGEFANEFEIDPELSRSFGGITSGANLNSSTLTSSFWSGSILLQDRFHFNRSVFLQPGVTLNIPYSYETASQTPGAAGTEQMVNLNAAPSVAVGYLPVDWILIEASATLSDKGSNSYPAAGNGTSAQTSQTYATVQVALAF